ncbi:MAG: ATP synthase F1 subunit delta, partial [Ilumatobacteraceae bacterium]|nr:ATP synthase F1 subunit delta [Ilumatobacteraceae bacterium]
QINAYVAAMFEIASANDAVSVVEDDMFRLARAIESNEQLRAALNDTSLPADRRQNIVEQLLGGKAHNVTVQLVSLLVGTGHISLLPQVADALVKRASSSKQMEVAEVRSAVVLTDAQKARLAEALSKVAGKPVNLKVVVDPSVIGGLVATIGDEVIDDTVRTRLDQVKARF